jgi:hypothetical protein
VAGRLRFTVDRGTENRVAVDGHGETIDVAVMRLDDVLDGAVPVLLKVDVEGHELAVMHGATRLLADRRLQALIVETDCARGTPAAQDAALRSLLAAQGFHSVSYDFRARALRPAAAARNALLVRDLQWAAARLRAAPRFRLVNGQI